jgi:flagellin-like protein
MKGISPMIATVLLVAFTVALGGIIMLWFTSVTTTTAGGTESQIQTITKCASANFKILSVDTANDKVTVTHFGSGLTVYPIIATIGSTVVTLTGNNAPNPASITSGGTSAFNATIGDNTTVKVTALCQYGSINTTIEASCTSPEDCWH